MKPILTAAEMRAADAAARATEHERIRRAAWHVARHASDMLGGVYGRRIVAVAGPGNNGNDARVAADILRTRGARVDVKEIAAADVIRDCDLVIDGGFGVGFRGEYCAPDVGNIPVLAIDLPSGVFSDTGEVCSGAVRATRTVTFAAYKPGHFLNDGPTHCGEIHLCDIAVDVERAQMWQYDRNDAVRDIPRRSRHTHKWNAALTVVAGSVSMIGAARLAVFGAMRSGAGMVHVMTPGDSPITTGVTEAIHIGVSLGELFARAVEDCRRTDALVIGPGLGRGPGIEQIVRDIVSVVDVPVVIDGDALYAFRDIERWRDLFAERSAPTMLTPHAGEFARFGIRGNVLDAVRHVARLTHSTIMLKGPTTLIADEASEVRFVNAGDPRLATAGTGDVLAGMIGSFFAQGLDAPIAGSLAAYVHGAAACMGYSRGFMASDLPELVAASLTQLEQEGERS